MKKKTQKKTQNEIFEELAIQTGLPKTSVKRVLKAQSSIAVRELKSTGIFNLTDIGKIIAKQVAARKGRNPKSGKEVDIPAKTRISLRVGKPFKLAVG